MESSNSVMAWLCWIAVLGTRGVEAQDDGDGGGNSSADANANFVGGGGRPGDGIGNGGRGFGHRNRPGFRKGGRFGKGRKGQQQGSDQAATNDQNDENDDEDVDEGDDGTSTSSSSSPTANPVPVDTSTFPNSIGADTSTVLPEATTSSAAIPSISTDIFEQPTSIADAFPGPQTTSPTLVGIPYVAPSSSANTVKPSSQIVPAPTSSLILTSSLISTKLTVTTSTTVYVTSSPLSLSTSIPKEESSATLSEASQASQAPALDLAPLPASSVKPLSAGEKAGVGIGITFAILVIAGAIAYEIYRRRKMNARNPLGSGTSSQDDDPRRSLALAGFFGPTDKRNESNSDPEWSIESAEKVSIVRAGSIRSVDSQARPMPPPKIGYMPSDPKQMLAASDSEVAKMGMAVPSRKPALGLASMALGSNPPVSPSAFPSPPKATKTGSWPLPD